jgi:hypothetical protein
VFGSELKNPLFAFFAMRTVFIFVHFGTDCQPVSPTCPQSCFQFGVLCLQLLVQPLDGRQFDAVKFQGGDAFAIPAGKKGRFEILRHRADIGRVRIFLAFVVPTLDWNGGEFFQNALGIDRLKIFLGVAIGKRGPCGGARGQLRST